MRDQVHEPDRESADLPQGASRALPPWVHCLGVAAWLRDPDGKITFMNDRAEALLGVRAADCLGKQCHAVIKGREECGRALCGPECGVQHLAMTGGVLVPTEMTVPGPDGNGLRLRVFTISIDVLGSYVPRLLHFAFPREREHRALSYLERLLARDESGTHDDAAVSTELLTTRERDVLELLSEDYTLQAIALELNVSYVTVRNHVQHILSKLGVHSIIEAVAVHLLSEE